MRTALAPLALLLAALPLAASASGCYADPVYSKAGTVKITSDARIRSAACTLGTDVLFTAKSGTVFSLLAVTDGWYKVKDSQGREGWVWTGLAQVVSNDAPIFTAVASGYLPTASDVALMASVKKLVVAKDDAFLAALTPKVDALLGRPLPPRTQYVLSALRNILSDELAVREARARALALASETSVTAPSATPSAAPVSASEMAWNIPYVDEAKVRAAWLGWYNAVRSDLGLVPYSWDSRLDRTALEWSKVSAERGAISHKRDLSDTLAYNYAAITNWFAARGLVFNNVNRATHTENIGFGYFACPSPDGDCTQAAIDGVKSTFDMYMRERDTPSAGWGRAHYESIVKNEFRIVGLGIVRSGNKYYLTVHYGTSIR